MLSQSYVTPKPIRQEFNHPLEVKLFLVSETMVAAAKRTGHSEITHLFMDELKKYISIEDMAYDHATGTFFRNFIPFKDLVPGPTFLEYASECCGDHNSFFNNNAKPLSTASEYTKRVDAFLRCQDSVDLSCDSSIKPYTTYKLKDVLLVGVKDGFLNQLSKKENLLRFYIDSLELLAYSLASAEVRSSRLYRQFVKLSLS